MSEADEINKWIDLLIPEPHRSAGPWRRIETAPLDGTPLLLFCPGMKSWNRISGMPDMVVGLWTGQWESDVGDVDQGYESTGAYFVHEALSPTHWMPLPEPPTGSPSDPPETR